RFGIEDDVLAEPAGLDRRPGGVLPHRVHCGGGQQRERHGVEVGPPRGRVLEELPHEGLGKGGEVGKWFIGTEVQLSTYPGLGDLPAAVVHVIVRWAAWPQRHLATDRCGQGLVDVRVVAAYPRAVSERDLHRG